MPPPRCRETARTQKPHCRASGFTLLELMIVIVIIGVLAAVAVPIYSNNVNKAKQSEADASLGSIRRLLLLYKAEYGEFPKEVHNNYIIGADWNDIVPGELTGKYFSDSSYTYRSTNTQVFRLICDKGNVLGNNRTINELSIPR